MSAELELFFKKNHKNTENVKLAVTSELCDKDGKPLEWEIRKLNTREVQALTKECVTTKQIGKKLVPSIDEELFTKKLMAESVVFPDLNNAALQDSYGVKTPEALIVEMVSCAGDFMAFAEYLMVLNNINKSLDERVDEAKN